MVDRSCKYLYSFWIRMDEFDLYEAEHADEFDALDDLQINIPGI